MNKRILITIMTILLIAVSVNLVLGQDNNLKDKEITDKALKVEMQKGSHHKMMMAFRQNIVNLAKTLGNMARDEKNFDKEIARIAIEEMEHGLEKMDEIHSRHLATLTKEIRERVEAKMEKKSENETVLNESICELSITLQSETLNLKAFENHANAIVEYFVKKKK